MDARKTQNQLRKFCRSNFLSYIRMREWRDIYAQLEESVGDLESYAARDPDDDYEATGATPGKSARAVDARAALAAAIHRSILTGLFGHLGQRTGPNTYRLAGQPQRDGLPRIGVVRTAAGEEAGPPRPRAARAQRVFQPPWAMAGRDRGDLPALPPHRGGGGPRVDRRARRPLVQDHPHRPPLGAGQAAGGGEGTRHPQRA